jgi:hypothetical protein
MSNVKSFVSVAAGVAMTGFASLAASAQDQPVAPVAPPVAGTTVVNQAAPGLPFQPNDILVWIIIVLVLVSVLLALVWLRNAMTKSTWSLSDALSEEADVAWITADGLKTDATGKPVTMSELRASTSRLIALLGAIVILFLFLGFGAFVLYQYGTTGAMPPVGDILKFLAGGLALFAPYAVNKLSSLGSP